MVIAIDYDNTFSADPALWATFIADAKQRGHKVFIVTCRRETEENLNLLRESVDGAASIYFTSLQGKKAFMEKRGWKVDVWIDDDPRTILEGY